MRRAAVLVGLALSTAGTARATERVRLLDHHAAVSGRRVTISVTNHTRIPSNVLKPIERAVAYEANHSLRRRWHTPRIRFGPGGWAVTIVARSPSSTDLGIHSMNASGKPYAIVSGQAPRRGVSDSDDIGVTLAHEVFEMLVNPTGTAQRGGWMLEVADPVVSDDYHVRLPRLPASVNDDGQGVHTASFVTPHWFVAHSRRPWDIDSVTNGPGDYSNGFAIRDGQLMIPGGLGPLS